MYVSFIYLIEMTLCGAFTIGSLRPHRVFAALQMEPPSPAAAWPQLRPLADASRRFSGAASKLIWLAFGVLLGVWADDAGPDALLAVARAVAIIGVVLLVLYLGTGGARFGVQYARTVRAHPELGIQAQPVWATAFGGALTAMTAVLALVTGFAAI